MNKKVLVLLLIEAMCFVGKVKAQTTDGQTILGISPAIIESVLTPGEVNIQKVRVTNSNNRPVPIKAMVKDWINSNDSESELAETVSAKEWVVIEPADFIMEANSTREIEIRTTPPIGATPGGHYASIFLNPVFSQDEMMTQIGPRVIPRVTVQLMLLVKGEMQEKLKVVNFEPDKTIFWSRKMDLKLELGNMGNVHLVPKIYIKIEKEWPGSKKEEMVEDNRIVIPGQKRQLLLSKEVGGLGKYKVTGYVQYGTFGEKINLDQIFFWILPPIWLISVGLFALTTMVAVLIMKYRNA
jgi:hypothetical protein